MRIPGMLFSWNVACGAHSNHDGSGCDTARAGAVGRIETHAACRMVKRGASGVVAKPRAASLLRYLFYRCWSLGIHRRIDRSRSSDNTGYSLPSSWKSRLCPYRQEQQRRSGYLHKVTARFRVHLRKELSFESSPSAWHMISRSGA
jgi:hypothetical protein